MRLAEIEHGSPDFRVRRDNHCVIDAYDLDT